MSISLAVIVVLVSVLSVVVVTSGNYVAKLNGQKLYNYEYTYYLDKELSSLGADIEIPDDATDEKKMEIYKKHFSEKDEDGKYVLDKTYDYRKQ